MELRWIVILLTLVGCGSSTTAPPSVLQQITSEVARIRPVLDKEVFEASGDSLLFAGLLCGSGEAWACDVVHRSQAGDGTFYRSPTHLDRESEDMSRDQGLGPLLAVGGPVPMYNLVGWVRFLNENDGYLSRNRDDKAKTTASYRKLIEEVTRQHVDGSLPDPLHGVNGIGVTSWFNEDYELHLNSLVLFLNDRIGNDTLGMRSSRKALVDREPDNCWFQYLNDDANRAANCLLTHLQKFDTPVVVEPGFLDWMWQRPAAQWYSKTYPNGWEFVMLANFLGG